MAKQSRKKAVKEQAPAIHVEMIGSHRQAMALLDALDKIS